MSYFVGVDIGGTNVEMGILNELGEILIKKSIKTDSKKEQRIHLEEYGQQSIV